MSHTSPATYLVWSIITCILFAFMVFHMWSFDRFRCLRWNNGPHSGAFGAFKRVMTYTYLFSVPGIMTYAVGFAVIKYQQGFVEFEGTIIPKPYIRWPESSRRAIFPLMLTFTISWSLEIDFLTPPPELCFWLFLVNSKSVQPQWFRSGYFRTWVFGSIVAPAYMVLLTTLTRDDPLKCEAYTFLAGSIGSLSLTLWFIPILLAFPAFLASLRGEGVDSQTIVRLTKFHELNTIRVVFRFMFAVPFVILGTDGVMPHVHINESTLWTDLLGMVAAFGLCISSALTLVIFFPRDVVGEIAAKDAASRRRNTRSYGRHPKIEQFTQYEPSQSARNSEEYLIDWATKNRISFLPSQDGHADGQDGASMPKIAHTRPVRRRGEDVELNSLSGLAESNPSLRRSPSKLNPMVYNFTSPIGVSFRL
ncbi:hypothetical protein B0H13DRAFT_2236838 [Mycena leptocephala]|nr:hypothetical protein B0H13DRAFT_2236838 [Mycena leptocephala]